ncbi:MAG: zinc ABC transporter substrate-binding protein [Bacteroidota bacterium]
MLFYLLTFVNMRAFVFVSVLFLGGLLPAQEAERKLVVASASIFADIADVIGGDLVEVRSIVPIGGDPHVYEPTPADVSLVSRADLILMNGLTFEGWINELVANSRSSGEESNRSRNPSLQEQERDVGVRGTSPPAEVQIITKGIEPIGSTDYANASDPHAWMNAVNGKRYVINVRDALINLAPEFEGEFRFNAGIYLQQLDDLESYINEQIERIPAPKRVLITSHDAFQYYGRHYGLRVEAALGTSTDAEVQTNDVARLTSIIRELEVPAIFVESTINPKLLRQIATDNGVIIGGELFADSLAEPEHPAGTYLGMLRHNTDQIVSALLGLTGDIEIGRGPSKTQQGILLGLVLFVMLGAFGFMVVQLNRPG